MLNSTQIKKIRGKKWQTSFSTDDIENIFDECGPFNGLFYSSQFSLTWFIRNIFNDKFGKPLELEAFQQVALDMLWTKKFPILLMTRGGGKSFLLALYALLRALLVPGSKIVIVSSSFRQAKYVFRYIEELYDASPILQEAIGHQGGPKYGSDTAYLKVGLSYISALPIGTGDTIRGQRASVLLCDEIACLDKDTIVETNNGLIRISDFDKLSQDQKLLTGDKDLIFEKPDKFIKTPLCDVYEIKLKNGYTIKCSKNHQIMTNNGWKKPEAINIKTDFIESENQYNFPNKNIDIDNFELTKDFAWVLGLMLAEGDVTHKYYTSVYSTEMSTLNKLNNILTKYNIKTYIYTRPAYIDERGWDCKESYQLNIHNKKFRDLLYKFGLDYSGALNKKIPWSILASPKDIIISFLNGLYEGDGSCFLFDDKKRINAIGLSYYSASERLCRDVQILLNKLGFNPSVFSRESEISENLQWFTRLTNNEAFECGSLFSVERFQNALNNCSLPKKRNNITWDKSRNKWKIAKVYLDKTIQKRFSNKQEAIDFLNQLKTFRKITSIKKLEQQDHLYDYHLPITHSFYADGCRQHNSIPEQIFDIILSPFTAVHANPAEKARISRFIKKLTDLGANEELIQAIRNSQDFGNQIVMSGTTALKNNHLYRRYKTYKSFINSRGDIKVLKKELEDLALTTSGKANPLKDDDLKKMIKTWKHYAIMQLPYTALPEDFLDEDSVRKDKASFPEYRFKMEYLVEFSDDSDGFIKRTWVDRATPKPPLDLVPVELYGDPKATYVMGLDPARWNDNFGCVVLKITPRGKEFVYCTAWDRTEHHKSANKIREVCHRFNIQYIAMDKGGGGDTVRDELCRNVDGVDEKDLIWTIPEQLNSPADLGAPGRKILELVDFSTGWISEAAHAVEADIEKCNLLFPYNANENDIYQQYITHFKEEKIGQYEKDQLNMDLWGIDEWEAQMLSTDTKKKIEPRLGVLDNINECLNETCAIKRNVTPKGVESFDLPNLADQPEGLDMRRRDRWTALMLANYAAKVHMGHGHKPKNTLGTGRRGGYMGRSTRRRGSAAW